ncbi:MAG: hypothetical protein A2V70_11785 [Planctomycetes bacterium RBG_13_63_9]|nr:MAG: hypothetical protein A2V70_11785 [Planctomycetes bacterium RBG_13_63_9]
MAEDDARADQAGVKKLSIQWPEDLSAVYANNLVAQNDSGVLVLSFFQVNPPYILGASEEERREVLDKITSVSAIPAAKLAIPLHHIPGMIQVIQQRFEQASKEAETKNDASDA